MVYWFRFQFGVAKPFGLNLMSKIEDTQSEFSAAEITRPDPVLLKYYAILSLLAGPFFPIALIPQWIRYSTLKYSLDDDGVAMSWGFFFRREIYLTYRRIQDIHVTRNILQRWLCLANVSIQTASGSAAPEMVIEGILQADQLRDYLYSQMRGAKGEPDRAKPINADQDQAEVDVPPVDDPSLELLVEISSNLRRLVELREQQQ
jgi:uncharacterized membrane protein YdbT with pleckstrin-like domain